jgi:rRNA maturation protein Rpf1
MPTVHRENGYRFYFYSHENFEPPHIHVDKENNTAKFWLIELSLARNIGFNAKELKEIREIIKSNHKKMTEKWYEYFN